LLLVILNITSSNNFFYGSPSCRFAAYLHKTY
jgi:hypothetical protein